MARPWFEPNSFQTWANLAGTILGTAGGILGGLAGWLAPEGRGRRWLPAAFAVYTALGVVSLLFGVVALAAGQPAKIWQIPLLVGVIVTVVGGLAATMTRRAYEQAEQRRLEAEAIRRS